MTPREPGGEISARQASLQVNREGFHRLAARAYENGYRCHGDLGMDWEAYASRLLAIARKYLGPEASWAAVTNFVGKLHTDDLYLTTACARNNETAWHLFRSIYRKCTQVLARNAARRLDSALELADLTLIDMFLPDRSGESRIASYHGRSSLATWLRVIVSNRVINERQRMWNRMQRVEPSVDIADAAALRSVESGLRNDRYERVLSDSLQSVCLDLAARERLILLWRYEEGLQLGQIARLLGVHQSTVTRQLERLLRRMRGDVVSILASRYQLSLAAIEECLSVIVDSPSHSISVLGLIRQTPSRPEATGCRDACRVEQPEAPARPEGAQRRWKRPSRRGIGCTSKSPIAGRRGSERDG